MAHFFGPHTSTSGGLFHAVGNAHGLGATAFALFTRSQRRWTSPPLEADDVTLFQQAMRRYGYEPHLVLPHAGYLINLGSPDKEKRRRSIDAFVDEMQRVHELGLLKLNVHPGSSLGLVGIDEELKLIASSLDEAMERVPDVHPVLETTSGSGFSVGSTISGIRDIIALSRNPSRIGLCIDTCHSFVAGYDLRTEDGYEGMMEEVEEKTGLAKLEGMHLNDTKGSLGSHLDRHERLGKGEIGKDLFIRIAQDPRTENIPLILETPVEDRTIPQPPEWKEEVAWLKAMAADTPRNGR